MQPRQMIQRLMNNISTVIVGKQEVIEYALIALLCRGHVLIEDVPGVGKTTLASALAKSLDCTFRRIQFTPDLMPSDVTGYTLVNFKTGETEYREGSVMSQVVLADEPHQPENAVRPAGSDGRAAGDGGWRDAPRAAALYRAGDAESGRICGHISPAGSADGSLFPAPVHRLPDD